MGVNVKVHNPWSVMSDSFENAEMLCLELIPMNFDNSLIMISTDYGIK